MAVHCSAGVAIQNVAVATDFSPCSEHAVEHGLAIARHFGATLHFLHLLRPSKFYLVPEMIPALADAAGRDCEQLVDRLARQHQLEGVEYRRWVEEGEIADIAGRFIDDHRIDLLILGTHGRSGMERLLLGSVAQQMFHSVRCPVLTVGPRSPGAGKHLQLKRVLFSTDLSHESLAAVPYVLTAVREWHAALDVLHICASGKPEHREAEHREAMDRLREELAGGLDDSNDASSPRCSVLPGKPAACVLDFAGRNQEDLIVLGLKPHRALYSAPLWSHAYEIVRQARCPVLSIRSAQA